MRMRLKELPGMSAGAKGHGRLWCGANGLDPEILDEFPEPLHGIARVGLVEVEILNEPLDAVAHELLGEKHGARVAVRLEEEGSSGLLGKVRVFVQIHAVTLLKFGGLFQVLHGGLGFDGGRRWCGFFIHERSDGFFCSFKKCEIAQVI
jgi:hypothetical protein